jgi:hypothetical protein
VSADEFLSFLKKAKAKEVKFLVKEEEIEIECGKAQSGFAIMRGEFIREMVEEMDFDSDGWNPVPDEFSRFLSLSLFSASKNRTSILSTVHVTKEFIETTDDETITVCEMEKPFVDDIDINIPAEIASSLSKYEFDGYKTGRSWIYLKSGELMMAGRLFTDEDDYPNLDEFVDFKGDEFSLPEDLKDVIEQAMIGCKAEKDVDKQVSVSVKDGQISMRGEGDAAWVQSYAEVDYNGPKTEFVTNPVFIRRVLDFCSKMKIGDSCIELSDKNRRFYHLIALPFDE